MFQRIPNSNILPQPKNDQEEKTQTSTLHITPQIVPAEPGDLSFLCQN